MKRMHCGLFGLIWLSAAGSAYRQNGIGAKFGAPDPHTCASRKAPQRGAKTAPGQCYKDTFGDWHGKVRCAAGDGKGYVAPPPTNG